MRIITVFSEMTYFPKRATWWHFEIIIDKSISTNLHPDKQLVKMSPVKILTIFVLLRQKFSLYIH